MKCQVCDGLGYLDSIEGIGDGVNYIQIQEDCDECKGTGETPHLQKKTEGRA